MEAVEEEARPHTPVPPDEDIQWSRYVFILVSYWWLIAAGAVLGGLLAFGLTRLMPKTYEAVATIMVTQPKIGDSPSLPANVSSFRALLESNALAQEVIREFRLDAPPHRLTPRAFLQGALRVEEIRNTNLIRIRVQLPDPQLAAAAANSLVQHATELNQRINQDETVAVRDYIQAQLDHAKGRLAEQETALLEFKRTAQIDLARKDAEGLLRQRGDLLKLLIDVETERARLRRAEQELSRHLPVLTMTRAIDGDPVLLESSRDGGQARMDLQLKDEIVNPVYQELEQAVATIRTTLAGLEQQRREIVDVRKLDASQMQQLTMLYQKEIDLAGLETEHDLAKRTYLDLAMRYEQARIQVASKSSQLQVVDPAILPDRPTGPRFVRITGVGFVTGLFMAAGLALLVGLSRTRSVRDV